MDQDTEALYEENAKHNNGQGKSYSEIVRKASYMDVTKLLGEGVPSSSNSSRNEYYLQYYLLFVGGTIALLLQDHRTMSTKSVCSSQYMVTDQH